MTLDNPLGVNSFAHKKMFEIIALRAVKNLRPFKELLEKDPLKKRSGTDTTDRHPFIVEIKRACREAHVSAESADELSKWEEELNKAAINKNYLGVPYSDVKHLDRVVIDSRNVVTQVNEIAAHTQNNTRAIAELKNTNEILQHKLEMTSNALIHARRAQEQNSQILQSVSRQLAVTQHHNQQMLCLLSSLSGGQVDG